MKRFSALICLAVLMVWTPAAFAAPVSEQLYFTKSTPLMAGSQTIRFSLWNTGSGGTPASNMVWWEIKQMNLTSGTVTTYLGSVADAAKRSGLIGDIDFSEQYWVQIDNVTGIAPNYTFTPVGTRTKLNMVPYAMHSITSETAASGGSVPSVTAGNGLTSTTSAGGDVTLHVGAGAGLTVGADAVAIKPGGITNTMLADSTVTSAKIADGTITGTDVADSAITLQKINSAGAVKDQSLTFNGTGLIWQAPRLSLPYYATVNSGHGLTIVDSTAGYNAVWGWATAAGGVGVKGKSDLGDGVVGESDATGKSGVYGANSVSGGFGVYGRSTSPAGADNVGFLGGSAYGAFGFSSNNSGVRGETSMGGSAAGVYGYSSGTNGNGVWGVSDAGVSSYGVLGTSSQGFGGNFIGGTYGVRAQSTGGPGLYASSVTGIGAKTTSGGSGIGAPAMLAENTNSTATEPSGIAIFAKNHGGDTTIVAQNTGSGDTFRSLNAAGTSIIYRVTSTGRVVSTAVQITGGGDLAERFEIKKPKTGMDLQPGMVVSIDPANPGKLMLSSRAYDRTVAGIISGAGGINSGMVMGQEGSIADGSQSVALTGRVYVKADATRRAIRPGDLLTSSDMPGHAMKVASNSKAQGAIIGKAMTGLDKGTGLVLVLVTLQ